MRSGQHADGNRHREETMLGIGEMARANCVTPRTLRLYQERGILEPRIVSAQTGYRSYSITQSARLDLVARLQSIDLSLHDIARIIKSEDVDLLLELAYSRKTAIEDQLAELIAQRDLIDSMVEECRLYTSVRTLGTVLVENLPDRTIVLLDAPGDTDLGGSRDYTEFERWEWFSLHAKRQLIERGYPMSLYRRIGGFASDPRTAREHGMLHSRPFFCVSEPAASMSADLAVIPAGTYLTSYYSRCHEDDGSVLERQQIDALLGYAASNEWEPTGPLTVENEFSFIQLVNDGSEDVHSGYRYCLGVKRQG